MKKKFVYLRLNIQQYQNYSISVDQISYINNNDCVEMDAKRKANKNDMLTDIETEIQNVNWTTKLDSMSNHTRFVIRSL